MYLWRCALAVGLGLIWYFSGFEHVLVQGVCCALGFLLFFLARDDSGVCESSTQTDCAADEVIPQQGSECGQIIATDEPDTTVWTVQNISHQSQYPNIQRSLQHMFKCAYTQLVLPWSTAPEPEDSQPLHTALFTEFNLIVDEIICKAKDLDLPVVALGCIQIFTQHLHNTKQSEGSPPFSSKAEEFTLLREFCKALIHNLFPKHLWEPNVYYCVLQEILAMKALDIVTLLSDPDNLNHLIISQLDQMPSENPIEEVPDPDRGRGSPSSKCSENSDVLLGEAEEHPSQKDKAKKKGKKLKEKFSKVLDSMNPKKVKLKRKEKEEKEKYVSCRRPAVLRTDDMSSNEGFSCDSADTDVESLTGSIQEEMMEFKLSYEMWRAGNWAVSVTNVQMEENELCFTVHLEEINNPANLHWDVKKNQSDIIQFYNRFKEIGPLPSLSTIVEKTEWNKEEAREILEHSLQDVVNNQELGNSKLMFQFLGPMDWILHEEEHDEGLWALLGGIASFLTRGQDDESSNPKGDEKQHEVIHACKTSEATPQHELDATQPVCTNTLERQDKETEDESVVADGGHLPTLEASTQEDYVAQFLDQPEVNLAGIQSVGVNIAQFAMKRKYLKFEHNFTRQPAAIGSSKSDEDTSIHCTTDAVSINNHSGKEENLPNRKFSETDKPERMEKESHPEEETLNQQSAEKKMSNSCEQPEANKVIFDLLKEICGNSYTFKLLKTVVTPFTPLIKKKLNAFLKKMNPSEAQIANYIDSLCESIWPDKAVPQPLPQNSDNKNEIKQKAMQIITSKFAGLAIISKTNVESIFKIFQNAEENKKLVYMMLTYLLKEFLPAEPGINVLSKLNVKRTI